MVWGEPGKGCHRVRRHGQAGARVFFKRTRKGSSRRFLSGGEIVCQLDFRDFFRPVPLIVANDGRQILRHRSVQAFDGTVSLKMVSRRGGVANVVLLAETGELIAGVAWTLVRVNRGRDSIAANLFTEFSAHDVCCLLSDGAHFREPGESIL